MNSSTHLLLPLLVITTLGVLAAFFSSPTSAFDIPSESEIVDQALKEFLIKKNDNNKNQHTTTTRSLTSGPTNNSTKICYAQSWEIGWELYEFTSLSTNKQRCASWPTFRPCFLKMLSTMDPNAKNTKQFNMTFSNYDWMCKTVDKIPCYSVSDDLALRHQCYYQKVNKSTGLCEDTTTSDSDACAVSVSGKSCVPRFTQSFTASYCTACFSVIRNGLLEYYKEMQALAGMNSSSSSDSSDDSSSSSSSGAQKVGVHYGIILSEAGFAAADARNNLFCSSSASSSSSCSSLARTTFSSGPFQDPLTRLLFDFSEGAPSYLTSTSTRNIVSDLSQMKENVCSSSSSSSLRCFRTLVIGMLSTNKVLLPSIQRGCEEGRNESAAVCNLEADKLKSRLNFWQKLETTSEHTFCNSEKLACIQAPATTFTSALSSCFEAGFSDATSAPPTKACMDNITSVLNDWGCCVPAMIDVNTPSINSDFKSLVQAMIEKVQNESSTTCSSYRTESGTDEVQFYVGLKFGNLPYQQFSKNSSLVQSLTDAVVTDVAVVLGLPSDWVVVREFMEISSSSSSSFLSDQKNTDEEPAGAFYPHQKDDATFSSSSSKTTGAVIMITLNSKSDTESTKNTFNSWTASSSPTSPEIDVVLTNAGFGNQQTGSSSVSGSFAPPPVGPTSQPGAPPTPSPSGNDNKKHLAIYISVGVVGGLILLVVAGLMIRKLKNRNSFFNEGDLETGSYQEVKTQNADYDEVQ